MLSKQLQEWMKDLTSVARHIKLQKGECPGVSLACYHQVLAVSHFYLRNLASNPVCTQRWTTSSKAFSKMMCHYFITSDLLERSLGDFKRKANLLRKAVDRKRWSTTGGLGLFSGSTAVLQDFWASSGSGPKGWSETTSAESCWWSSTKIPPSELALMFDTEEYTPLSIESKCQLLLIMKQSPMRPGSISWALSSVVPLSKNNSCWITVWQLLTHCSDVLAYLCLCDCQLGSSVERQLQLWMEHDSFRVLQWRRRYSEFSKTSIGQATFLAGVFLLFYTGIAFKILNLLFILWWLAPFLFLVFNKFSPQVSFVSSNDNTCYNLSDHRKQV